MKKSSFILIGILVTFLTLAGCVSNTNDERPRIITKEDKYTTIGKDFGLRLITGWFNSETTEEFEQNYISLLHDRFLVVHPSSSLRDEQEYARKWINKSEVVSINNEAVDNIDDNEFIYTARIEMIGYYADPEEEGKPSSTMTRNLTIKIQKNEQGEYKVRNYDLVSPYSK